MAEFERRELLKMRVHHALRKASTAILARFSIREILDYFVKSLKPQHINENRFKVLSFTSIMMGVVDLEIHYASHGQMVKPPQPPDFGIPCHFTWNSTVFKNGQTGLIIFSEFLSTVTRTSISIMTIISSALIWWYSELERRLLVIRHHLVEEIGLIRSPLSRHYMFELGLFSM